MILPLLTQQQRFLAAHVCMNHAQGRQVHTHDARFEWWSDLPLLQQCPVNLSEERMKLDGLFQPLSHNAAQTFVWTLRHKLKSGGEKKTIKNKFF